MQTTEYMPAKVFHVVMPETHCKFEGQYIQLQSKGVVYLSHTHVERNDGHILQKIYHSCCCIKPNERLSDTVCMRGEVLQASCYLT